MPASPRHWTTFAACLLVAVAMPFSTAAQTVSSDDCEGGWESNWASDSCGSAVETLGGWTVDTDAYIVWASGGVCRVQVDCALSDNQQQPKENDVTVSHEQIASLVNCEGELKIYNC